MTRSGNLTALILRMQSGDVLASEELYRQAAARLKRISQALMRQEAITASFDACDLVQEAYVKKGIASGGVSIFNREHFFAIMRRGMQQVLIDRSRSKGAVKRQITGTPSGVDTADPQLQSLVFARKKLAKFDPSAYRVLILRNDFGLTWEEISAKVGQPVWNVRREYAFAIDWLRSELE